MRSPRAKGLWQGVEMKHSYYNRGLGRFVVLIGLLFSVAQAGLGRAAPASPPAGPSLSGVLTIIWGDARDGTSAVSYYLTTADGRRHELSLAPTAAPDAVWRLNGRPVTVYTAGASVAVRSASAAEPLVALRVVATDRAGDNDPLAGQLPYLSLLCAFPDGDGAFGSATFHRQMYGNNAPQLGHYWDDLSYGAVSLAGSDVAGPFAMPHPTAAYGIPSAVDLHRLAADCFAAADPTVNFAPFHGVNLMFNVTSAVWSVAYGGGWYGTLDGSERFIAMSWLPTWAWGDVSVVAHEMGHSFGLPHSSGPYGYTYDNPWDVMSGDRYPCYVHNQIDDTYGCVGQQTIGYHKSLLGWLAQSDIYTAVAGDQSVELDMLAAGDNGRPRLIVAPVLGPPDLYYTIEARQTAGYDQGVPGTGVVIHRISYGSAILMDGDGNGDTTDDGSYWTTGETFAAPDDGITITVTRRTATGYEVEIGVDEPPPFTTCAAQAAQLAVKECAALVALYQRTNGPHWTDGSGWLAWPNPCSWRGVGCSRRDDAGPNAPDYAITELWLNNNGLQGPIPSELANLPALRVLYLADNHLSGPLPPELGRLAQLEALWLGGDNRLTGRIPPEWGQLTNLRQLVLYTNDTNAGLGGPLPEELGQLAELTELHVSRQDLSGPIPAFLGQMSKLKVLALDGNRFEGLMPAALGDLAELQHLDVQSNPLSGSIPHTYMALPNLLNLITQGTGLCQPPDAAFQAWFGSLYTLHDDILCDTSLAGSYGDGAPGSRFVLRGVVFPVGVSAAVAVNGRPLGSVQTDEFGEVYFLLDTQAAGEGRYDVTVEAGQRALFTIRLDDDRPQRQATGAGPVLVVPPGAAGHEVFVPLASGR